MCSWTLIGFVFVLGVPTSCPPTWSINDELLGLGVVDGRGLHLDGVVAVTELREAEASDVVEVVDAVEVPLVVPLRPQFQHCSAKQVELQTES